MQNSSNQFVCWHLYQSVEQTAAIDLTVCCRGWFSQGFGVWLCVGRDEADEFVEIGALNGIFVLGRSMGFIGESVINTPNCDVTKNVFKQSYMALVSIH